MKAIGDCIFFKVESEEVNRTAKIGDVELIIPNFYSQKEQVVIEWGEITSVSRFCEDEYQVGDTIVFHHNTIGDNALVDEASKIYSVYKGSIYCVIRNGEILMRNGYLFYDRIEIEPKKNASGLVIIENWKSIDEREMLDRNLSQHDVALGNYKLKEFHEGIGKITHIDPNNEEGLKIGDVFIFDKKIPPIRTNVCGTDYLRFPIANILAVRV
jgi:hypothetical protein